MNLWELTEQSVIYTPAAAKQLDQNINWKLQHAFTVKHNSYRLYVQQITRVHIRMSDRKPKKQEVISSKRHVRFLSN